MAMQYFTLGTSVGVVVLIVICVGVSGVIEVSQQTSVPPGSNDPLCRIIRNTRRTFLASIGNTVYSALVKDCAITHRCTTLLCLARKGPEYTFGLKLDLCDDSEKTVQFLVQSISNDSLNWSDTVSPSDNSQRIQLSLDQKGVTYYLNVKFVRWFSQHHPLNPYFSTLRLGVALEVCNGSCDVFTLFDNVDFSLRQLCDFSVEPVVANLMSSVLEKPVSIYTSQIGITCDVEDPFKCGINSICRATTGNAGVCDCCHECFVLPNGSCVIQHETTTTEVSISPDGSYSSLSTGVGAILAIMSLLVIGGGMIYGVKHNAFMRIRNRCRLYCWTSWCRRFVEVNDQVNMFNPLDDSDDPPLL